MPDQEQSLRIALYARVSTEEQREGQTIDSQLAELRRFAGDKHWTVIETYQDEGWSGSILARPNLDRLRDDGLKGDFEAVLVNDVDRLARDVSHLGILKRDLEKKNIQLIFRKLPSDKSPTHNLMVNILGSFAEFEREMIIDRTRRGRRHKIEVRKQYVGCVAPYGYCYHAKTAVGMAHAQIDIIPDEARVVREIYRMAGDGIAVRRIAVALKAKGILTRKGRVNWQGCTIYRILRNQFYAGVWSYGKSESCEPTFRRSQTAYRRTLKTGRRAKPRQDWLSVSLPETLRLIEPDFWLKVQKRISQNQRFSPRNTQHEYLLAGLVRCGQCSRSFCGRYCRQRGKLYFYYCCWNSRACTAQWVRRSTLDAAVWESLRNALLNPALLESRVLAAIQRIGTTKSNSASAKAGKLLAQIESEEGLLIHQYRSGTLSPNDFAAKLETLRKRKISFQNADSKAASTKTEAPSTSIADYCQRFEDRLNNAEFAVRRRILRELIASIVVQDSRIVIRGKIGPPEADLDLPDQPRSAGASRIALPPSRERIHNRRMAEFELVAALPPPASNSRKSPLLSRLKVESDA
jgi:site-specific DNA recombinase